MWPALAALVLSHAVSALVVLCLLRCGQAALSRLRVAGGPVQAAV